MKKTLFKTVILILACSFLPLLSSCGSGEKSTLFLAQDIAEQFPFKYGAIYSDGFSEKDVYFFSSEMKKKVFGENSEKYTYIISVSGYFSRDMISGSEVIVVHIDDRSHRAEITSVLYRRAAMNLDVTSRVWCEGDYVFLICDSRADEIIEYIKSKM